MEFFCRRYGDLSSLFFYRSVFLYVDVRHFSISMKLRSLESFFLYCSDKFDNMSILFCSFLFFFLFEFSDFDTRNLDKNIDTIKNRSREAGSIFFYDMRATATFFFWISEKSTWTGVHGSNKRKPRRISTTHIHAIDGDFAIFEWLSESLKNMFVELEKFIKKKNSFMCEGYFPRTRISSSTNNTRFACSMMYDTEWTFRHNRHIF